MELRMNGVADTVALRERLERCAPGIGLTPNAVNLLVQRAQVGHWRAGRRVAGAPEDAANVYVLVQGAVKLTYTGERGRSLALRYFRPGEIFGVGAPATEGSSCRFAAVAHLPSVVGAVTDDALRSLLAVLPPSNVAVLVAHQRKMLFGLLTEQSERLLAPLPSRLAHALRVLARDFGMPHPQGVMIDLPLTHTDLGQLVVASRANVCRCLADLRRTGRILIDDRRLVMTAAR